MHRRTGRLERLLGIEHERQALVGDPHRLGGILRPRARIGHHGRDPLARIARDVDRERTARHVGRVEPGGERQGRGGELASVQHVDDARHSERRRLVDRDDAGGRIGAGDERHVAHARERDVGDELPLADHETAVLAHAAVGGEKAEAVGAHATAPVGWLAPRMRSAASAIASTICA